MMVDLSTTIIPKSDQQNAEDFLLGPRTVTITDVRGATGDQPIAIHFENDDGKPFKPCKTVRRVLVSAWGKDGSQYVGRSMTLYNEPSVMWAGKPVGGIRVSHLSHIEKPLTLALTVTRGNKKQVTIKPLKAQTSKPSIDPEEAFNAAKFAAERGTDAFTKWWNSEKGKPMRAAVKPRIDELKAMCAKADEATEDEVPFGDGSEPEDDDDLFPGDKDVSRET